MVKLCMLSIKKRRNKMTPSKVTWHGKLKDGEAIKMDDGMSTQGCPDEEEIATSRQAALDFLKENNYTVAVLLADIQPIASC